MRAPVVGSLRTAEEWGRSFPGTSVTTSGGDHVLDEVPDAPGIVVATPGAEPRTHGGYAAAVLLDTWLSLSRPGMRAGEESLRRWFNIAGLVRPVGAGGRVVAVGEPTVAALQALVRWDPAGFAARELAALINDVVAAQLSVQRQPGLILINGEFGRRLADHGTRFGLSFETVATKAVTGAGAPS